MIGEAQILKGCRQYNKLAQRELYNKYAPAMRGICMRYVNNSAEVKDIVQEGFLKIFSKIKQYSGKGSFEGWMKRIIINTAIDHFHKNRRYYDNKELKQLYEQETSHNEQPDVLGNEIDKKEINTNKIDFSLVEKADFSEFELLDTLKILPANYKIVFNLHCIEQFKHKEIAKMLKIDENTSRSRLLRARSMIQKYLYAKSIEKLGK